METETLSYEEWLKQYLPIEGAEEDDDVEDDHDDEDLDDEGVDDDVDDDEQDEEDDPEAERLRQQLNEAENKRVAAERAAREAKKAARDAAQRAHSESGNFEALANERQAENEELREQLIEAQEKAEAAEFNLDQFRRKVRVTSIAARLHYKDPADAMAMMGDDDTGDDKTAERALVKLAERKPYLVDQRRASGTSMNGTSRGLTMEQIKSMSPEEVNANWEAVQSAMAANGG